MKLTSILSLIPLCYSQSNPDIFCAYRGTYADACQKNAYIYDCAKISGGCLRVDNYRSIKYYKDIAKYRMYSNTKCDENDKYDVISYSATATDCKNIDGTWSIQQETSPSFVCMYGSSCKDDDDTTNASVCLAATSSTCAQHSSSTFVKINDGKVEIYFTSSCSGTPSTTKIVRLNKCYEKNYTYNFMYVKGVTKLPTAVEPLSDYLCSYNYSDDDKCADKLVFDCINTRETASTCTLLYKSTSSNGEIRDYYIKRDIYSNKIEIHDNSACDKYSYKSYLPVNECLGFTGFSVKYSTKKLIAVIVENNMTTSGLNVSYFTFIVIVMVTLMK
eukprot:GHVR01043653.1.p1 GENE.GHVR01043653.1~~GHVR01043653.1.p1  ORF type:complete len:339 (+),score=48.27 GHVR01043653.1:25-1017(+)